MHIARKFSNTVASLGAKCSRHLSPLRSPVMLVRYRATSYKHLAPPEQRQVRQVC
jgi:hypothetical protein